MVNELEGEKGRTYMVRLSEIARRLPTAVDRCRRKASKLVSELDSSTIEQTVVLK